MSGSLVKRSSRIGDLVLVRTIRLIAQIVAAHRIVLDLYV